ncbi:hypothetical protein EJB05_10955 [Eragrostis curvula]|uniref:Peroxidase n=1 Tax=Eragrostis curvula TaxID=38414 RepID=A0A5J9VRA5_9POAL|nr:hypothetical protein EJB05_10955 [Eragrostis curvula]
MANKLAVLVTLLALSLGPAASQGQGSNICFNGWLRLPSSGTCPRGSRPDFRTRQRVPAPTGEGLSFGYYNNNNSYCPQAERIVKDAVKKAVDQNPGIGAGLIRLFFHDCFVRGCDGSVLLTATASGNSDTEREGPPNKDSLRGFEVIDAAKAAIEAACPGIVSCADIVAFAARDASSVLSNGRVNVPTPAGRLDGRESFANETDQLPGPFSNLTALEDSFWAKGLSPDEMVTLSGAHTIGHAKCQFFSSRFADMDPTLAAKLKAQCNGNDGTFVDQDDVTPNVLDSQYYKNVIDKKVLFDSDAALTNSTDTVTQVTDNANSAGAWERKFEKAMESMGKIGVKVRGSSGAEIRKVCSRVNN